MGRLHHCCRGPFSDSKVCFRRHAAASWQRETPRVLDQSRVHDDQHVWVVGAVVPLHIDGFLEGVSSSVDSPDQEQQDPQDLVVCCHCGLTDHQLWGRHYPVG